MAFSHQRLVVYQRSLAFIAWSHPLTEELPAKVSARNQLERASTSTCLNLAEGNVKSSPRDRRKYWEIALGSAVECAACLDVLVARRLLKVGDVRRGMELLEEAVSMLVVLIRGLEGGRSGGGVGG